ncbi:hydroxyethylthiazole kinase [Lichenicoccus sp.]|uniref:hydroxyethylthiazole kinase n=1 Tax=Lichenicoccus sp. TaxID=2781899 RepID=UPI003D0DA66C
MTAQHVAASLLALRARTPLVHSITNLVVTNSTANALLALGASPAMVEGEEEVVEFAALADALVINLGTMNARRASAMALATAAARQAGTPWVLDPVAVGVIQYRSEVAVGLLAHKPRVIRGNASEIIAFTRLFGAPLSGAPLSGARLSGARLSGAGDAGGQASRGVDSRAASDDAREAAGALARATGSAVVVSGATDYATDGISMVAIDNGHPMMPLVTGLGCTATAIIGACLAVVADPLAAAVHGMVLIGLAGELAGARAPGPGTLQVALLDALHALDGPTIEARARLRIVP